MKDLTKIEGREFISRITDEGYGIGESFSGDLPDGFSIEAFGVPIAYDGCGNLFTENQKQEICFWNHETDEVVVIAKDWDEFFSGCVKPEAVKLDPKQVKSAWVDPEFAKQMGINVPSGGWIKRADEPEG